MPIVQSFTIGTTNLEITIFSVGFKLLLLASAVRWLEASGHCRVGRAGALPALPAHQQGGGRQAAG